MATSVFYERLIRSTKAQADQDHIWTIISSHAQIPDRTDLILGGQGPGPLVQAVKKDIEIMEVSQVANIGVPCNTFHYFYDDIQVLTEIPIINMVEETVSHIHRLGLKKIALLSTKGTWKSKIYKNYGKEYSVNFVDIDEAYYDRLADIIYQIKATSNLDDSSFVDLVKEIEKTYDVSSFVLACTELSLLSLDRLKAYNMVDAMDVLVKESITRSGYDFAW